MNNSNYSGPRKALYLDYSGERHNDRIPTQRILVQENVHADHIEPHLTWREKDTKTDIDGQQYQRIWKCIICNTKNQNQKMWKQIEQKL